MHDAFECVAILEKLPLEIECIATCDNKLLVGTSKGHLLVYEVREESPGPNKHDQRFEVELLRSNRSFGRKPIAQLVVVKSHNLLISLSDGQISVHDFVTYGLKSQFPKSKGVTLFALDIQEKSVQGSYDDAKVLSPRLCAVMKRKIQTYSWDKNEFVELHPELSLPDIPKTVAWIGDSICIGLKKDYMLLKVDTGEVTPLFETGRKMEPLICPIAAGELALCKDEVTVFLQASKAGSVEQKHSVTFSDVPIDLAYRFPYVIAALPKHIEVCSRVPKLTIQRIDLPHTKRLVQAPHCYAASVTHVWRLVPVPLNKQIDQLVEGKMFEMALALSDQIEDGEEKRKKVHHIKNLYAFDLFRKTRFDESLNMFKELDTEPTYVIGLYPNLLPDEYRKQLDYPYQPPTLSDGDLEKGFHALTSYLTRVRNQSLSVQPQSTPNVGPDPRKMLLQIIDTSLLKCYLQTNEAMITPLLRLKDNNCHVEECERVLVKAKKVNELVLLYQSKGIHKKALDLLLRQAEKASGPLKGPSKTIEYLQKLGAENLQLIFDYSAWVLKMSPEDGLKIFTEDTPEIEGLPRDKVLAHLDAKAPNLVIQYLEHIVFTWNESEPNFHNMLVNCYKDKILPLLREYMASSREGEPLKRAGKEPGELGELRRKLLFLLETSTKYQPSKLLKNFPAEALCEEGALLFGKAGRHEEALAIYIYVLKDTKMAEQYCRRQYENDKVANRDVYISLFKLYLMPNELPALSPELSKQLFARAQMKPNIPAAFAVLNEHHNHIDLATAMDILPSTTEIKDIRAFLTNVLERKMQQRRNSQILRSLLYAEDLQMHEQRIFYEGKRFDISDERACRVCHKRIGTSAFARYPNGVIVHYYCCKDRRVCPVEAD